MVAQGPARPEAFRGAHPAVAEASAGCHLPGSSSRNSGCRYLGARASANSLTLVPAVWPKPDELEQRCQFETVPFPFAPQATCETGTSPIPRGV